MPIKAELRRCHKISQVLKKYRKKVESTEGKNKQSAKALMHWKILYFVVFGPSHTAQPSLLQTHWAMTDP